MTKKLTFLAFLIASFSFSQSAWTKKKGEVYTQLSFSTIGNYNDIFGNPDYKTERTITDNTLQIYGEYGLSDKSTLIVNIPLKFIKTDGLTDSFVSFVTSTTADSKSALGNLEIGLRQRFYNKKWVVSGQLNVEANTSSYDNASGIRTGFDAWSFTPTINAGRSFKNIYIQGFTGVNIRTNGYSSNFKFGAEFGYKPIKQIWLIALVDIVKSFKNGDVVLPQNNFATSLYINNQEFSAFGLKAIGEITDNFGVNLGVGGAFTARNVPKQVALNFGVYSKF